MNAFRRVNVTWQITISRRYDDDGNVGEGYNDEDKHDDYDSSVDGEYYVDDNVNDNLEEYDEGDIDALSSCTYSVSFDGDIRFPRIV